MNNIVKTVPWGGLNVSCLSRFWSPLLRVAVPSTPLTRSDDQPLPCRFPNEASRLARHLRQGARLNQPLRKNRRNLKSWRGLRKQRHARVRTNLTRGPSSIGFWSAIHDSVRFSPEFTHDQRGRGSHVRTSKSARSTRRLRRGSKPSSPRSTPQTLPRFSEKSCERGHWLQNDRCGQSSPG